MRIWQVEIAVCICVSPALADFRVGDIFLNDFWGGVQQYRPDGTLVQVFTDTGTRWEGACATPDWRLVTTKREPNIEVYVFTADGSKATFPVPEVQFPGDISVFADGTLAIDDQAEHKIELYSTVGTHLGTINVNGVSAIMGNAVGRDDTIWSSSSTNLQIAHFSKDGTSLGGFVTAFKPGDIAIDPLDGTLWVPDRQTTRVYNLSQEGNVISSFSTLVSPGYVDFTGLAMNADRTLYVTSGLSKAVYHYNTSGQLLDSFSIPSGTTPVFLNVVLPEPATLMLVALGGLALLRRRRAAS
ncbi:MAG: PEP-CTERM sorting domain-containing protein [Candidatus Atribacteria bacterium]|nr:PEP-CTERM sorting domain-containing protein [Candidatus Atribacteria bacterium]